MTVNEILLLKTVLIDHIWTIIVYCILATITIIIILIDKRKRRNKYKVWKKDTINFGFIKREYELSEDKFINELWDENMRLESEIKLLRKKYNNLTLKVFLIALIISLSEFIKNKIKKQKL